MALTSAQFSMLTMIAAYPGYSSADLARIALLTPQTVSLIKLAASCRAMKSCSCGVGSFM